MIVFLTLMYVVVLFGLVKIKIIQLNLFWKLSPILWMLLLFVFLFIPLQWGAPSGNVNVYQMVVEVIPNVTGEVVEVPAKGMQPMKKDDVLFQIDPEPFQIQVISATVALQDAKQKVEQLKATADADDAVVQKTIQGIEVMKEQEKNVVSAIISATAGVREAEVKKERAESLVSDLRLQTESAKKELARIRSLASSDAISDSEVDITEIQYTRLQSQLNIATIDTRAADEAIKISKASLDVAHTNATVLELRLKQQVETELPRVSFNAKQSRLAADAKVGDKPTLVASAEAALDMAKFNLKQTTVRAPGDGYPIGVTLRPGQRVANFPVRSWMSFVNDEATEIVVGISQYAFRHIKVGQPAEVTFKLHPGKVFSATVDRIATVNEQGQLVASGNVPNAPGSNQAVVPFGIVLKLTEDSDIDVSRLPGGSAGTAAIYTEKSKAAHVIRKVMLRMQAWQNYVLP